MGLPLILLHEPSLILKSLQKTARFMPLPAKEKKQLTIGYILFALQEKSTAKKEPPISKTLLKPAILMVSASILSGTMFFGK